MAVGRLDVSAGLFSFTPSLYSDALAGASKFASSLRWDAQEYARKAGQRFASGSVGFSCAVGIGRGRVDKYFATLGAASDHANRSAAHGAICPPPASFGVHDAAAQVDALVANVNSVWPLDQRANMSIGLAAERAAGSGPFIFDGSGRRIVAHNVFQPTHARDSTPARGARESGAQFW